MAKANSSIDSDTNALRIANGLTTLTTSATLEQIAAQRAVEIASQWPTWDMSLHEQWIYGAMGCILWGGENLAYNYTGTGFAQQWYESTTGHRENMLNPNFDQQGSATYVDPNTGIIFAVQVFADTCDDTGVYRTPTNTVETTPGTGSDTQETVESVPEPSASDGAKTQQLPDTAFQQGG